MTQTHVNAVIIGAGAAGGIVAKELAVAGLRVTLLERGRFQSFDDHDHDELISQRTTVLGNAFGPDDTRHKRVIRRDGEWRTVLPSEGGYQNNAACVGGGTFSYGAMAWRFMEQDFRMRSTYGTPEGSTLEDWPISYQDLEPYYERAEWEIGVSGDHRQNPFSPPQRKAYPMPPMPYTREGHMLEKAAQRLQLHPFPVPMLRNSVPYGGRPACIHCRYCVGFACEVNAKCGTHNTVIPVALATGNCDLKTECVAKEITTDSRGRVRGVVYYDQHDREQFQPADLVVVSASGTESPRLLLNSKSQLFPTGLGNRNDWVGRNLQGHGYPGCFGLFEQETYDDVGPGACIAICDYNHGNPGLRGGAMLANEFIRLPYLFAMRRPKGAPRWGKAHKDFQRNWFKRSVSVMGPVQEMPVFQSHVEVDPVVTDHWGIPVARISGQRHPHDLEISEFVASRAKAWLEEAGAVETWTWIPGKGVSGGQHQAGTCRMGKDPKTSVVNRYCQMHDIDNLFVVDGSVHVTNGGFNPVLTIMAIAYWASDYINREWKGTRFR
ncbi:MAG: GMC family oxidoreductase [Acidobacteriota bacterium]